MSPLDVVQLLLFWLGLIFLGDAVGNIVIVIFDERGKATRLQKTSSRQVIQSLNWLSLGFWLSWLSATGSSGSLGSRLLALLALGIWLNFSSSCFSPPHGVSSHHG
mmetsp:Transcript_13717/g.20031  ORF Transcript_13717/g.20031 Transcript_13717/m.20031 type:complete len:106 (-) Transcript_13717:128-445(-)